MSRVTRRLPAARPADTAGAEASARVRWGLRAWLLVSVLAVGVIGAGLVQMGRQWLAETPVRVVQILGDLLQTDRPALQSALDRTVRGNFFTVNLDDLATVARRFPWVADVSVSRRWPDAVAVAVSEKQAVARWAEDGLVSSTGEVFRPSAAKGVEQLPVLDGPRAQSLFILQNYRDMHAILERVGLRIQRLALTDRMSWEMTLEGGIHLFVDAEDTLAKLQRFTLLYDHQLAADIANIARVDLRYRNGVAIGWRHG